jgi:hypothetical protein
MQRKEITIRPKESQKDYMSDFRSEVDEKRLTVRKTLMINETLNHQLEEYIYARRLGGEVYYTLSDLIREALWSFLDANKQPKPKLVNREAEPIEKRI